MTITDEEFLKSFHEFTAQKNYEPPTYEQYLMRWVIDLLKREEELKSEVATLKSHKDEVKRLIIQILNSENVKGISIYRDAGFYYLIETKHKNGLNNRCSVGNNLYDTLSELLESMTPKKCSCCGKVKD